jgi:hypothetical protein
MMSVARTLRLRGAGSGTGTAGNIVAWGQSNVPRLDPGGCRRCAARMLSTERSNPGLITAAIAAIAWRVERAVSDHGLLGGHLNPAGRSARRLKPKAGRFPHGTPATLCA